MSQTILKHLRRISSQALTPWKKTKTLSSSIKVPLARWGKPYLYALAHAHEFQTRAILLFR